MITITVGAVSREGAKRAARAMYPAMKIGRVTAVQSPMDKWSTARTYKVELSRPGE